MFDLKKLKQYVELFLTPCILSKETGPSVLGIKVHNVNVLFLAVNYF